MLDKDGDEIHRALRSGKVVRYLSCRHPTVVEESPSMPTWNPVQRQALSKKQAQAPGMVGPQQGQAGLAVASPEGPMQAPAGDQPQQKQTGGRPLSRHEIITEAEILIRNALFKGIKIGTMDLVKYMQGQYGNPPEELYEGCTKAWEKVQWEEQEAFESAKGPGPQQPKQEPGAEPEESPVSLEDVAEEPGEGPAQVRV